MTTPTRQQRRAAERAAEKRKNRPGPRPPQRGPNREGVRRFAALLRTDGALVELRRPELLRTPRGIVGIRATFAWDEKAVLACSPSLAEAAVERGTAPGIVKRDRHGVYHLLRLSSRERRR